MTPRANLRIFTLQKRSLLGTRELKSIFGPKSWKVKGKEGSGALICARKRHGKEGPREALRVGGAFGRSSGIVSLEGQSSGGRRPDFAAAPGRFRTLDRRESVDDRDSFGKVEDDASPGRANSLRLGIFGDGDRSCGVHHSAGAGRRSRAAGRAL